MDTPWTGISTYELVSLTVSCNNGTFHNVPSILRQTGVSIYYLLYCIRPRRLHEEIQTRIEINFKRSLVKC